MVDAVVSIAIDKLGYFVQEANIRMGVKDAIIWLRDELSFLQVSVTALETKHRTGHIRLWIDSVKDVANEAVIILERFSTHQEAEHAAPKQGFLDRMQSCIYICKNEADLYDIGKEIESLKERVIGINNRRKDYKIDDILASLSQNPEQRKRIKGLIPFENEVDVVGFEDDVKTLLAQLVSEDPFLRVISIHGMGGLGKTTLARKLYDSRELCHFQHRIFVCVSQEYDIKDVLRRMIKSVEGPNHELGYFLKMEELDLLEYLRNLLGGAHFLVVIDDLWDMEAWKIIKKAFPEKKKGSRVIVTTRNKNIAQIVDDRCFVHELRSLREDEAWQLFSKKAKPTQNLEKLGEAMVKKCRGLPLAIVVLGGLLLHKKSYGEWLDVKDHLWRKLEDSSEIQDILILSYNDLSFQIRQCFLYLARFPEDHTFEVDKLMNLWIAEEFISEADKGDGVVMEDVAKDYLNELINRNMIQIARLRLNEEVEECRIHDLVRDLAIEKAREHKLLGIFDSSKQHSSSISLLQGQPRHAIYNGIGEYLKLLWPSSDYVNRNLRSLALINETDRLFELQDIKSMYTRFKYLKVLDLTCVKSEGIPGEIGDLVLLKFLGLMKNENIFARALVIPPTISKLKKLQTLCGLDSNGYEFPEEMSELKELRHLSFKYTSQRHVRGSFKIGSDQTKLQTLGRIWSEDWILIDTINLTNLRTLIIMESSYGEYAGYTWESIANLTSLQTIVILFDSRSFIPTIEPLSCCERLKTVYLYGKLKDSSELSFLPDSVTCLTLACSGFAQDPMPALGSLSNLTALDLTDVYIGKKMLCSHDGFPSLKFLRLSRMYKLEELHVEDGALPSLKGFGISNCSNLRTYTRLESVPAIPDIFTFLEY